MKIHSCVQGEGEWHQMRCGKVTASEADNILTPEFKIRDGETPKTYLAKKLAEHILGRPLEGFNSFETDQGHILEIEARNWFAFESTHNVRQVGFIEHDDGRCGCSPDALLDDDGGLELKSPQPTNHVKYLLDGKLPSAYRVQVHFSMYVTGLKWWKFISYRRKFKPFVLRVERDEAIQTKIKTALDGFYQKFDAALANLK